MKIRAKAIGAGLAALALAGTLLGGCDETTDEGNTIDASLVGIWRRTEMQGSDTLLEETSQLTANGHLTAVRADFQQQHCLVLQGNVTTSEDSITTIITTVGNADTSTVAYNVDGNTLTITDGGNTLVFHKVQAMPTCDDYGFGGGGQWTGMLTATIDGTQRDFGDFLYGGIDQGVLAFGGNAGGRQLQLTVLSDVAGIYDLGTGNMGVYVPDTGNPTNLFTTVMTLATGSIDLSVVSSTHIMGTFSFTALNMSTQQTVQVTDGFVDITAP